MFCDWQGEIFETIIMTGNARYFGMVVQHRLVIHWVIMGAQLRRHLGFLRWVFSTKVHNKAQY